MHSENLASDKLRWLKEKLDGKKIGEDDASELKQALVNSALVS